MGRLIDADELLQIISQRKRDYSRDSNSGAQRMASCYLELKQLVEKQLTAYDVDKVVEQLKECERYVYDAVSDEDNYVIDTEKAIEIVKGAVKDESDTMQR